MSGKSSESNQTLILGFDALDFRYLDLFSDDLHNFNKIREQGVTASLESTHPPWTGSAWPTMYTGSEPSRHNAYSFFDYGENYPTDAELISRNHVEEPAIWNYLTAIDEPSIVLNVPVTHPAEPINGVLIPGYLANEDSIGYPSGIRDELNNILKDEYRIYSKSELSDDKSKKLSGYIDLINIRKQAAIYLLEEYDWSVAIIQVQKTDAVFHNFSHKDDFKKIYRSADKMVGDVIRTTADDTNIIICSDHGMKPVDGYQIFVNEILRTNGFLKTSNTITSPTLGDEKAQLTEDTNTNTESEVSDNPSLYQNFGNLMASSAVSILGQVGVTPGDVYNWAQQLGIGSGIKQILPSSMMRSLDKDVDWQNSLAYCRIR